MVNGSAVFRHVALLCGARGQDLPTIPVYDMCGADASVAQLHGFAGSPTNAGDGWNMERWTMHR
jgi:hypothetical protein